MDKTIKKYAKLFNEYKHKKNYFFRTIPKNEIDLIKNHFKTDDKFEALYLLNNYERPVNNKCDCGKYLKFKNFNSGYGKECPECKQIIKNNNISNSLKSVQYNCITCGTLVETVGKHRCKDCIDDRIYTCKYSGTSFTDETLKSTIVGNVIVLKQYEIEYMIQNGRYKLYCEYRVKSKCTHCGDYFDNHGDYKQEHCKKHRKLCSCGVRFNTQNKYCSIQCSNSMRINTTRDKYNVDHNLKLSTAKPSSIGFYLKHGYSEEDAFWAVYEFQNKATPRFKDKFELYEFIETNKYLITNYNEQLVKRILNLKGTLEQLFNSYILKHNIIYGTTDIYMSKQHYSYNIYTSYMGEIIVLRSLKEFYFYNLLIENNIKFKTNKMYPNSKMYYDFLLVDTSTYIEITGFMNEEKYKTKMNYKKEHFNAILLETPEEMLTYIKEYLNENQ